MNLSFQEQAQCGPKISIELDRQHFTRHRIARKHRRRLC